MSKLIDMLEELPDSSVFGSDADAVYTKIKDVANVHQLIAMDIPSADHILRNVLSALENMRRHRPGQLVSVVTAIPAVAVQDDFI